MHCGEVIHRFDMLCLVEQCIYAQIIVVYVILISLLGTVICIHMAPRDQLELETGVFKGQRNAPQKDLSYDIPPKQAKYGGFSLNGIIFAYLGSTPMREEIIWHGGLFYNPLTNPVTQDSWTIGAIEYCSFIWCYAHYTDKCSGICSMSIICDFTS